MKRKPNQKWCSVVMVNGTLRVLMPNGEPIPALCNIVLNDPAQDNATATVSLLVNIGIADEVEVDQNYTADEHNNGQRATVGLGPMINGEIYNVWSNGVIMTAKEFRELSNLS